MPLEQNLYAFLGAAVIGVIGAAGMYIFENIKRERSRHAMAKDLVRLDRELAKVKKELELLTSKKERLPKVKKRSQASKANSIISNSTADDYLSATGSASNYDSSDLEFYDISEDENDVLEYNASTGNFENILHNIDVKLNSDYVTSWKGALARLEELCYEYPDNPELLWRIGKACHKLSEVEDEEISKDYIFRGIESCKKALDLKWNSAEIHKWYAILIGSRSQIVSIQEKISDGHLFKKHIDEALALNPSDVSLHHLLGRFEYEVASLKWYERKVAAALFGEPPNATIDEALNHFLNTEKLADFDWKDNKLMIAKCKIATGDYKEAVDWLIKADNCKEDNNSKTDSEIKTLLDMYKSYR